MSFAVASRQICEDPIVIEGSLPPPVFTSRDLGWEDLVIERHCAQRFSVVVKPRDYRVRIHLGQPAEIFQERDGKRHVGIFTKGMVTVTPPGSPKAWGRRDKAEALLVRFPAQFLDRIACEATEGAICRPDIVDAFAVVDPAVAQIGRALLAEVEQESFASHVLCQSLVMSLAVHLLSRYAARPRPVKPITGALAPGKVRRTLEFIDENLGEPLTLQRITDAAAMSPYHFARLFKRATGRAPHQYIIERRLERAKEMLRGTKAPIADIALAVGCANQSHFSALFHRATGMTPLVFRRAA